VVVGSRHLAEKGAVKEWSNCTIRQEALKHERVHERMRREQAKSEARSDLKPVVSRRGTTALYVAKARHTRVVSETLTQNVLEVCRLDWAPNAVSRTLGKNHQRVVGLASEWEESRVMGWLRVSAARTWSGE
jgi:hypothetical protein